MSTQEALQDQQVWSRHRIEAEGLFDALTQYQTQSFTPIGDRITLDGLFRKLYGYNQYDYPNYHPNRG